MGLDLRLLPYDYETDTPRGGMACSQTILPCDRNYQIFGHIEKLPAFPVPERFNSFCGRSPDYDDVCYGRTSETPYGQPLTAVRVRDLLTIAPPSDDYLNLAVWAYLAHLSPATKVALYWY